MQPRNLIWIFFKFRWCPGLLLVARPLHFLFSVMQVYPQQVGGLDAVVPAGVCVLVVWVLAAAPASHKAASAINGFGSAISTQVHRSRSHRGCIVNLGASVLFSIVQCGEN